MAESASSQHASVPLGAMAHFFTPGTEAKETTRGTVSSSGASQRLGVRGRVLDVGWGLERGGAHNHAREACARI